MKSQDVFITYFLYIGCYSCQYTDRVIYEEVGPIALIIFYTIGLGMAIAMIVIEAQCISRKQVKQLNYEFVKNLETHKIPRFSQLPRFQQLS
jgi:hypothetical protein